MAFSNVAIFPQVIQTYAQQILPADTTTKKTLMTGGAQGSIIESINLTNTDTAAAYAIQLFINDTVTDHLIGTVNVPISSGNVAGTPSIDMLRSGQIPGLVFDSNGNPVLFVKASYIVKIASLTTVAATKAIDCVACGSDY